MSNSETKTGAPTPARVSILRLVVLSSCVGAINFGYTAEFGYATPIFAELGLSSFWTSFAWLAGPVAGIIFLPIASSYSDLCTSRWGRRRPYILLGIVLTLIGMLMFTNPASLSNMLGVSGQQNNLAIVIAVAAIWMLNIGLNVTTGPAWALVLDLTPNDQQHMSNAAITVMSSVSALIAQIVGWVNFQSLIGVNSGTFLFFFGLIYVVLFSLPTIIGAQEVQLSQEEKKELQKTQKNFFSHLLVRHHYSNLN